MLDIIKANVVYGHKNNEVRALNDLDLTVSESKIITVVGKSGSGKSTLLKMIAGYLAPISGKVILDGKDIVKMPIGKRIRYCSNKVGFVWQDFQLIDEMNARDNILCPAYIQKLKIDSQYLEKLIEILGISKRLNHYPDQLSGGEQQRVAIARAMLLKPQIVLADEPTGALDTLTTKQIIKLIKEACVEFSQTFIIATHDLDLANIGDHQIELADGRRIR